MLRGIVSLFICFLLMGCLNKKELFSEAYYFYHVELKVIEIGKYDGYYLMKGVSQLDTLTLISKSEKAIVSVNKLPRKKMKLELNKVYEFDLLQVYKSSDFGGIISLETINFLTKGNYHSNNYSEPKYYRVLEHYGYRK